MANDKEQTPPTDETISAPDAPVGTKQILGEKAEEYLREGGKIEDYPDTGNDAPTGGKPA